LSSLSWLWSLLQTSIDESSSVHLHIFHYAVCPSVFKLFYRISNNKYTHTLKLSTEPYTVLTHDNLRNSNVLVLEYDYAVQVWMDEFLINNDDTDPVSGDIHLPMYIHQNNLYNYFYTETSLSKLSCSSTFSNFIHSHYPHVRFVKHTRLEKCTFCLEFSGIFFFTTKNITSLIFCFNKEKSCDYT
jgi:hypothetical protein